MPSGSALPALIPSALYLRYSSEMQRDGYSIELQERYCRDWAERNGREVVGVYIDEAQTATDHKRAGFQRLLADCKSPLRAFVEVIVFHTWRFSRAYDDSSLFTQIESAGIVVQSASEGYNASTAAGRFQRHISLGVGAYQVEQLSDATRAGKRERAAGSNRKGVAGRSNGRPPFGYMRVNGVDVPDMRVAVQGDTPQTYWDGAQLFRDLALHGHAATEIAAGLNRAGFRTANGKPFSKDTITAMLRNQFYAGRVSYRGMAETFAERKANKRKPKRETQWFEGSHEPLFTADEWQAIEALRTERAAHAGGRPPARVYLLTERRCACCGEPMRAKWVTDRGAPGYICTARDRGIPCDAPRSVVREAALVSQIELMIEVLRHDGKLVSEVQFHEQHVDTAERYAFERDELQRERRAILVQHQKGYRTDEELDREIARIDAALSRLVAPTPAAVWDAGIRLTGVVDAWRIADTDQRRDLLTELLDHVRIDPATKRVTEFVPRAEFAAWFEQSSMQRTPRGWLPVAESEKSHPSG